MAILYGGLEGQWREFRGNGGNSGAIDKQCGGDEGERVYERNRDSTRNINGIYIYIYKDSEKERKKKQTGEFSLELNRRAPPQVQVPLVDFLF